eukprot:3553526-Amphidinium_carterae.2
MEKAVKSGNVDRWMREVDKITYSGKPERARQSEVSVEVAVLKLYSEQPPTVEGSCFVAGSVTALTIPLQQSS